VWSPQPNCWPWPRSVRTGTLSVLDEVPGVPFSDGVVEVGPDLMTGHTGIFAGGDMVPSERTVTVAIGHGKKAARSIDAFLRGAGSPAADKHAPASFGALNTWHYADAPATVRPRLEAAWRITTFDEVTGQRRHQARHRGAQYEIDCDYCKGCGLCAAECPCGAIEMEPEPS
jgi:NAD-dependent dihydropyrimidine dehydrogenase PreA subunit